MLIIKSQPNEKGIHALEDQPWREKNWMGEEWLEVPEQIRGAVLGCMGRCDLVVKAGVLTSVIPLETPESELVEAELSEINARLLEILDTERLDAACGVTASKMMTFGLGPSEKETLIERRRELMGQA